MNETTIKNMSIDIQSYLDDKKLSGVKAKDLMPMLIKKGYFFKDHKEGLPLRKVLRELDQANQLYLLPQVEVVKKTENIYWFFNPVENYFTINVSKYLGQNKQIPFNRYNSWNHCYEAFGTHTDSKVLSLHLGFYLASWGMYRGSGQLLQKDFFVHEEAVKIISEFADLRCSLESEVGYNDIERIIDLINKLKIYYSGVGVKPTNTLLSKIILGTLGCLPAFDRYFCDGVKKKVLDFRSLTKKSLESLFGFMEEKKEELRQIQSQHLEHYYPYMKLIDMYFWQIGFELDKNHK